LRHSFSDGARQARVFAEATADKQKLLYLRRKSIRMNLHEYQAKELLKKYNVPVQEGFACTTVQEAEDAYRQMASMG
jgi:hypothetical protein